MSIGNLKDSGNQGNNFPWQYRVLLGLQGIVNALTFQQTREHVTVSTSTTGTVPASIRGSIINVGNAAGTWNGISIPAGVSIPWDAVGFRDLYDPINYNATGTTFIIEYTI